MSNDKDTMEVENFLVSSSSNLREVANKADACQLKIDVGFANFASLPRLLRDSIDVFTEKKSKLLFAYSSLVSLSGTLTKLKGVYKQDTCFPNLYFMALAPAASGKGNMKYARQLLEPIHNYFQNVSKEEAATAEAAMITDRSRKRRQPPAKVVLIPGNTSSSKVIQHLSTNEPDTPSIVFETEMDTISITMRSEHGNYSDILRKSFHNEPVSLSRRKGDEYIKADRPKLAVVLSGTPSQLLMFINNREDGLLSRFLVMNFESNDGWQSVSPCPTCINLTDHFDKLALRYLAFWKFISKREVTVTLSADQWELLNNYCEEALYNVVKEHGDDASAIVKRHGHMIFKLCMVLSAVRKYEQTDEDDHVVCTDDDFNMAVYLANLSLKSSLELYDALPTPRSVFNNNNNREKFYEGLPTEFTRSEASLIGQDSKMGKRTVDRYLKNFTEQSILEKKSSGKYMKK